MFALVITHDMHLCCTKLCFVCLCLLCGSQLVHLACHGQARTLSGLDRLFPQRSVLDRLAVTVEAEELHEFRNLGVVAGAAHAMAPRNLLHLELAISVALAGLLVKSLHDGRAALAVRRRRQRRHQIERLKQEFAADLALVTRLECEAARQLLQGLAHASKHTLEEAHLHIRGLLAEGKRLDHAKSIEESILGVGIQRVRAFGRLDVHVDELRVAATDNDNGGADGESEESFVGYRLGESANIFLAILHRLAFGA